MSATRKLSNLRQLSLTCESPSPHQKRKSLKKQFSEDLPDFKDPWFEQGSEIHISLNAKNKKGEKNATDRPPSVKIAWGDKTDSKNDNFTLNDEVIIKKYKEIKRIPSGKLTRHPSLEKDSILNSKQDITDRLKAAKNQNVDKENVKNDVKPNLQIFLAHNTQDYNDSFQPNISDSQTIVDNNLDSLDNSDQTSQPKYLQPLISNVGQTQCFQIKKSANKKPLESPKAVDIKRPNFCRSNTIVVVPLVENKTAASSEASTHNDDQNDDSSGINVIIRPMTAQSRREKFQKRTNSAFHGTSKDQPVANFKPPLVRSSSAPSTKPEKSKFLATKRKLKGSKKFNSPKGEAGSPKNVEAKEWSNAAQTGSEIVTMVSLISPSGSENEDGSEDESKERPKSVLKRESSIVEKSAPAAKDDASSKEVAKNVSLRKTVKSVSFQQSSIHAVRSFSASFPARRGSMATALSMGNGTTGSPVNSKTAQKTQEKRGTNPNSPDADERVPKRRLVRSNTEENKTSSSWQKAQSHLSQITKTNKAEALNSTFTIDIQTKAATNETDGKFLESSMKLNLDENVILISTEEKKDSDQTEEDKDEPTYDTPKEKQCWAMYCKMTEKGINVSYDTILRGMLTPTEYRIRRRTSIAEEMSMLVNQPSEEPKPPPPECLRKPQPTLE